MVEVITKEIGINQISNSFKKVKDYYLNSLNNKESLYKRVESEIFDGSSFEEVKDYFVAQTNKKLTSLRVITDMIAPIFAIICVKIQVSNQN